MEWTWLSNLLLSTNWVELFSIIANISQCCSALFVFLSVIFIYKQVKEMRLTTYSQAYSAAIEHLQNEKVRQARRTVFQIKDKPIENWTQKEMYASETVCHTYDAIGQMVRHRLLPKEIIIDNWGPSLRNTWPTLLPLIQKYRQEFAAPEYWDDYEWLVKEAMKVENQYQKKTRNQ